MSSLLMRKHAYLRLRAKGKQEGKSRTKGIGPCRGRGGGGWKGEGGTGGWRGGRGASLSGRLSTARLWEPWTPEQNT